jgi:hydrogenase maturation protease
MKPALVIGYGNPLRGDDRVGWEVARYLDEGVPELPATIFAVQQLTPELAESISQAGLVIFVDASLVGTRGSWECQRVYPSSGQASTLGHHFDPAGLMAYAEIVLGSAPPAWLVSIAVQSLECGESFSPEVEATLPAVVGHIRNLILAFNREPAPAVAQGLLR